LTCGEHGYVSQKALRTSSQKMSAFSSRNLA
jgi:hypothetical protein